MKGKRKDRMKLSFSRLIIVLVQVRAMKGKRKDRMKLSLTPKLMVLRLKIPLGERPLPLQIYVWSGLG
jgi:hypothetical protein